MPVREQAPPGRTEPMRVSGRHFVSGNRIVPQYPAKNPGGYCGLGRCGVAFKLPQGGPSKMRL